MKYAELYRRTRIQETVYEALTQQHELAKVQEVKAVPTVKVLDPGKVPERKSFPPRMLILLSGTLLSLCVGIVWVLAKAGWNEVDSRDPRKELTRQIVHDVRNELVWIMPNVNGGTGIAGIWRRFERRHNEQKSLE